MYKKFKIFYAPEDDGGGTATTNGVESTEQSQTTTDNSLNQDSNQQSQADTKTYTQEDISKLQQQFETEKQVAIDEALKKAKMTADEKAKYEQEAKLKEIEQREKQVALKELKADASKILVEKNIPTNMLDFLIGENLDTTKKNIDTFKTEFDKALQIQLEQRLKGKAPIVGNIDVNSQKSISQQFRQALNN